MGDLLFLVIVLVFFSLTVLFVRACDSIIGPDPDPPTTKPDLPDVSDLTGLAEPTDLIGVDR